MSQVSDNPVLLKRMMDDMQSASDLFKTTEYWRYAEKRFLPELNSKGLRDFRRRKNSILTYFWATDLPITGEVRHRFVKKPFAAVANVLNYLLTRTDLLSLGLSRPINAEDVTPYFYHHVKNKFNLVGLYLTKCGTGKTGNPEDLVKIEGSLWSTSHLQHCSMIADAARYIPFSNDMIYFGLGEGLGRTVEILGQLYPKATFLLVDIPPQLYVCNQYLKKLFPKRLIEYDEAIKLDIRKPKTLKSIKGKIIILPPWKLPDWQLKISIFWNSASFQEMEPRVVLNYLEHVKRMTPDWIYINAMPHGNYSKKSVGNGRTTKLPVKESYYFRSLTSQYKLKQKYKTDYFLTNAPYFSYIFKRK